jgi:hypothetical protein
MQLFYRRAAIGFLIVLWGVAHYFSSAMLSLNAAATQSFNTLETAAAIAERRLLE